METTITTNSERRHCGCERHEHEERGCRQTHVHELMGSVRTEDNRCGCTQHNHRFATVTGEAEYKHGVRGHVHKVNFNTDTYEGHHHKFCGYTEGPVEVGCGRHVHFIKDETERTNQHDHEFFAATLIENPIGDEK